MGFWDDIKQTLGQAKDDAAAEAGKAAAKGAAKKAADTVGLALDRLSDEFLGDAETMLQRAKGEREGQTDVRPDSSAADDIFGRIQAAADEVEAARRDRRRDSPTDAEAAPSTDTPGPATPTPERVSPEQERKARALAELVRLKAALAARAEE